MPIPPLPSPISASLTCDRNALWPPALLDAPTAISPTLLRGCRHRPWPPAPPVLQSVLPASPPHCRPAGSLDPKDRRESIATGASPSPGRSICSGLAWHRGPNHPHHRYHHDTASATVAGVGWPSTPSAPRPLALGAAIPLAVTASTRDAPPPLTPLARRASCPPAPPAAAGTAWSRGAVDASRRRCRRHRHLRHLCSCRC